MEIFLVFCLFFALPETGKCKNLAQACYMYYLKIKRLYGENWFLTQLAYIGGSAQCYRRSSSRKRYTAPRDFFFFRDCSGIKRGEYERMRRMYEKKPTIIEDLAFLSVKYGVSLSGLFHALVEAKQNKKSTCENLVIDHRGTINDEEIFLIKRDGNVIVQFRIAKEHLLGEDLHIEGWMNSDRIQRELARQSCKPNAFTAIQDLRHGMKRVNVEAEVLENSKPSLVHTRFGNNAMVANALIADDTGKVKLCLWNEQVKYVALGNTIQIRNASVTAFKGERQLRLGKNGTLTVLAN